MGLALVHGRARAGVRAPAVKVEVHLAGGLPSMSIVGLPEAAVREAKDRVRAAIQCAQFEFPARRITVNLAPADLPKGCPFFRFWGNVGNNAANFDVNWVKRRRMPTLG